MNFKTAPAVSGNLEANHMDEFELMRVKTCDLMQGIHALRALDLSGETVCSHAVKWIGDRLDERANELLELIHNATFASSPAIAA
jgi:hypothetical protein